MSATKPVLQAAILQYAKQLRLPTLGDQFARLAEEAVKEKQSHLSYLEALLEAEVEERDRKAMARRIQEARFPSVKTLEEFDFQSAPHIPVALVRNRWTRYDLIVIDELGYVVMPDTAAELLFQVIAGRAERAAVSYGSTPLSP